MNKSLVLTGMMGVGKSTIGRLLANKLKVRFIDIDNLIEKKEGKSISKIFQVSGEAYFRDIEQKITKEVVKNSKGVIALGGGGFINPEIRNDVLKYSISFWLHAKLETLVKRYKKNKKRPLLKSNIGSNVKKIFFLRKKIYAQANFRINCDDIEKKEIIDKIIKLKKKNEN